MDKFIINGGNQLNGSVRIGGAKNAVLPIMACTLLADGTYSITNVPDLRDVRTMKKLLESIGAGVETDGGTLTVNTRNCVNYEAPYDLVKTMRASIYVLGPLISRFGYAKVSLPGGCAWGPRPVNLHIEGLRKMGARIAIENGYIIARADTLKGAHISFDLPSVGATGNLMMAAALAEGTTVLENAAREPEITATAQFLTSMGARIEGTGTDHLVIRGVPSLHPADTLIIPDRIEAGTFMVAAHMTGGEVVLEHAEPAHLAAVIDKIEESGARVTIEDRRITVASDGVVSPVNITTAVYPGFPTDMQAQWMSLMSVAGGSSVLTDTIYPDRFTHVAELRRFGADITLDHNVAIVKGVAALSGAPVMSTDLRASASLIIAGLVARGQTDVSRIYHIDRGYEHIEKKLGALGADIRRELETLIT
ncbi:UDP-N-acetylglucosamine 1-carboxyvinyltransferase [bacterium]|nr:UDP-N-acetylglucosamine 1-carboxyvinyltransferase [bacterium]